MLLLEQKAKFDEVRLAMERVRSGESEFEQIGLPSGGRVTIQRDETAPIGIRIQTPVRPNGGRASPRSDLRVRRVLRRHHVASGRYRPRGPDHEDAVPGNGNGNGNGNGQGNGRSHSSGQDPHSHPGSSSLSSHEGETFRSRVFGPDRERPPEYPEDLPFLPQCTATVSVNRTENGLRPARNAVWAKPADPREALEGVKSQLREDGWEEGETSHASTYMGHTLSSTFTKGGIHRVLALMAFGEFTQIMLFENWEG